MTAEQGSKYAPYIELVGLCRRDQRLHSRIITHACPHLDEMLAIYFLTSDLGWKNFNFSEDAVGDILVWDNGGNTPDGRPWQEHVREGKILLGCAPGSPFDPEHPVEGKTAELGQTCASAVAEFLRIGRRHDVKNILAAVVEHDLHGTGDAFHLGHILKTMHRYEDDLPKLVFWTGMAIQAVREAESARTSDQPPQLPDQNLFFPKGSIHPAVELAAVWQLSKRHRAFPRGATLVDLMEWRLNGRTPNGVPWDKTSMARFMKQYDYDRHDDILDYVMKETQADEFLPIKQMFKHLRNHIESKGDNGCVVGFMHAIESMLLLGRDPAKVAEWAAEAFEAKFLDGVNMLKATKELQGALNAKQERVVMFQGEPINILWAVTDNPVFQAAARGKKIDVFILRNGKGHTSVFCRKQSFKPRFLEPIEETLRLAVSELRRREFSRNEKPAPPDELLRCEGSLPELREWCYHKPLMMIMNGGMSAPGVRPTKLTLEEIVDVVSQALTDPS